jgi:WD40 repeat protein
VAFSPDGRRLAVSVNTGGLTLWDVSDPAQRPRILVEQPLRPYMSLSFSADGKTLVFNKPPAQQVLVDAQTLQPRATITASGWAVFTRAGTLVAPAARGNQFVVTDTTGKTLGVVDVGVKDDRNQQTAVSPDGTRLAVGLSDGTIRVLALPVPGKAVAGETGGGARKLADLPHPRLERNASLFEDKKGAGHLMFSSDGKYLAGSAAFANGPFATWDVASGKVVALGGDRLAAWTFMPDGRSVFAQERDERGNGLEVIHDLAAGRKKVVGTIRRTGAVVRFRFQLLAGSPDGNYLVVVLREEQIVLLPGGDARKAETLHKARISPARLAFSPDGKLLAAGGPGEVKLFDVARKTEVPTTASGGQNYLAFTNAGRAIATVDVGKSTASVYEVESGQRVKELDLKEGHTGAIYGAAFSPVGPLLVSYDSDGAVLLKNWETGKQLARIAAHSTAVVAAAFSPDGKFLATATFGTDAGAVRLWSLGDTK